MTATNVYPLSVEDAMVVTVVLIEQLESFLALLLDQPNLTPEQRHALSGGAVLFANTALRRCVPLLPTHRVTDQLRAFLALDATIRQRLNLPVVAS